MNSRPEGSSSAFAAGLGGDAGAEGVPDAITLGAILQSGQRLPRAPIHALLVALRRTPPAGTWHPTGFVVLPLDSDPTGALRLHLWPPGARQYGDPRWPVHDHTWELRSEILCGTVTSRGYTVIDDPEGDARLYAVDYSTRRSSALRRSDRPVRVHANPPRTLHPAEAYEVAAGDFHASEVEEGHLAATLVATQPTDRRHPWVVGPPDGPSTVPVERPVATPLEIRALLDAVLAALP